MARAREDLAHRLALLKRSSDDDGNEGEDDSDEGEAHVEVVGLTIAVGLVTRVALLFIRSSDRVISLRDQYPLRHVYHLVICPTGAWRQLR